MLVTEVLITGGLHLDGLMDTADGIAAGGNKCLKAMTDSRIGASGVNALLIIILVQFSALIRLENFAPIAILISSFWGRVSPLWAIINFPYLREDGSSSFHRENSKGWYELIPSVIGLIILIGILTSISINWMTKFNAISGTLTGVIPALLIPHLLGKKLKGHSGDSYGATVVIVETITLLILALFFPGV